MAPIGVFDSGFGGLTVLRELRKVLPQYDYLYLGDNARSPYGNRSFETVYHYTRQCVHWMFNNQCHLVILACNTASAKALRTIQQNDLPQWDPEKRVLGVIRPTAEIIGNFTKTRKVGILATKGTVDSQSYPLEIAKFFPEITVFQQACPMWVPIIENNLIDTQGAEWFFKDNVLQLFGQDPDIDTVLLGCTHYPLIGDKIKKILPYQVHLLSQGYFTATSLLEYLKRHKNLEAKCSRGGSVQYFTSDRPEDFDRHSLQFLGESVASRHVAFEH